MWADSAVIVTSDRLQTVIKNYLYHPDAFLQGIPIAAIQIALLARPFLSVCLSVLLSHSGIVSRRMKIGSCSFWRGKFYVDIRRGSPPAGVLK